MFLQKRCLPGQREACKSNSDSRHTSPHACPEGLRQPTPWCCPLLALSQTESAAAGWARKTRGGLASARSLNKPPMTPNTAPHPEQATAMDTAPKLRGKRLVETKPTHCKQPERHSNKLVIQNHARSPHRQCKTQFAKYSIVFATMHNINSKPGPCPPGVKRRELGRQSKQKQQVKLNHSSLPQGSHDLRAAWTALNKHSRRKPLPQDLQPERGHASPPRQPGGTVGLSEPSACFYAALSLTGCFNYLSSPAVNQTAEQIQVKKPTPFVPPHPTKAF